MSDVAQYHQFNVDGKRIVVRTHKIDYGAPGMSMKTVIYWQTWENKMMHGRVHTRIMERYMNRELANAGHKKWIYLAHMFPGEAVFRMAVKDE